ncbi:MAG: hypothetical protein PF517_00070 [Salinivirgaceae bacterium]|jgi:hypothetical protein|nr:hypothetical protein [Salinivirgaceae bacterium]
MFNFDQSFEIKEVNKGTCISDNHISGIGFANNSRIIKVESADPLEAFLVADIDSDSDGFEELYILTRSVGSGSYGKIIGITSNKGKSFKQIYIPEYDNSLNLNFEYLIGYQGHDSIYVKNEKLYRQFLVFKNGNSANNPTGGIRKLEYRLIEYNGSFTLQVDVKENLS